MPQTAYLRSAELAAEILRDGGIVAFPTETVYGLGVDATNAPAVQRLFAAKGRPADNPLIVHIGDTRQWRLVAAELSDSAGRFLDAFAPGPLTVVLRKHPSICSAVTAGLPTVGLRIPDSQLARELLRAAELPIAAPSANLSGRPSCTTWQAVAEDLDGRIDAILQGEACRVGLESTVVDCTRSEPVVLRPGGVSLEQLRSIVPATRLAESPVSSGTREVLGTQPFASPVGRQQSKGERATRSAAGDAPDSNPTWGAGEGVAGDTRVTGSIGDTGPPNSTDKRELQQPECPHSYRWNTSDQAEPEAASPGTRHPHYQPRGQVCLLDPAQPGRTGKAGLPVEHSPGRRWAYCGLGPPPAFESERAIYQVRFESLEVYAHGFFEFLRECDRRGVELVWVELAPNHGLGQALRDRQLRAAAR